LEIERALLAHWSLLGHQQQQAAIMAKYSRAHTDAIKRAVRRLGQGVSKQSVYSYLTSSEEGFDLSYSGFVAHTVKNPELQGFFKKKKALNKIVGDEPIIQVMDQWLQKSPNGHFKYFCSEVHVPEDKKKHLREKFSRMKRRIREERGGVQQEPGTTSSSTSSGAPSATVGGSRRDATTSTSTTTKRSSASRPAVCRVTKVVKRTEAADFAENAAMCRIRDQLANHVHSEDVPLLDTLPFFQLLSEDAKKKVMLKLCALFPQHSSEMLLEAAGSSTGKEPTSNIAIASSGNPEQGFRDNTVVGSSETNLEREAVLTGKEGKSGCKLARNGIENMRFTDVELQALKVAGGEGAGATVGLGQLQDAHLRMFGSAPCVQTLER
jgi:hypothetical protein